MAEPSQSDASPAAPPPAMRGADRAAVAVASLCGAGYLPGAPGTWATLIWGVPLALLLGRAPWTVHLVAIVLAFLASWIASGRACEALQQPDSPRIVIDELAGFLVATFLLIPSWQVIVLCFILFRLFDVLKPWPVGWADKQVRGGLGVTLDDVLAGLYSLALAHATVALWPRAMGQA